MTTPIVTPHDVYNRPLIQNLPPTDWINLIPTGSYNLVVVNTGTAGLVSAAGGAALGAKVAIIERHLMGGDCTNYGCAASKAIIRSARAAFAIREASNFGVSAQNGDQADFPRVMECSRRLRAQISAKDSVERFSKVGAGVYLGHAKFVGKNEIEVGGRQVLYPHLAGNVQAKIRVLNLCVPLVAGISLRVLHHRRCLVRHIEMVSTLQS